MATHYDATVGRIDHPGMARPNPEGMAHREADLIRDLDPESKPHRWGREAWAKVARISDLPPDEVFRIVNGHE